MYDEAVELYERSFIEQKIESLARGKFPFFVLRLQASLPASLLRLGTSLLEKRKLVAHCHKREKLTFAQWRFHPVTSAPARTPAAPNRRHRATRVTLLRDGSQLELSITPAENPRP
jgi:hypothetical protein